MKIIYWRRSLLIFVTWAVFAPSFSLGDTLTLGGQVSRQPDDYFEITIPAPVKVPGQTDRLPVWVEPIFGPEFTFSKECIKKCEAMAEMCVRCREHLVDGQSDLAKFTKDKSRFTSPNGWSFTVGFDEGVVEVQMDPMTVEKFKTYKDNIQDAIFASASNLDLFPYQYLGGGHINISWATFAQNRLLLRNFLVDLYNHNELAMGVFSFDTRNALPIQMSEPDRVKRFRSIISMIDSGELNTFEKITDLLSGERARRDAFNPGTMAKSMALNPRYVNSIWGNARRFEIRAVRPQASADVFVRQISLLRDRIHYLYKLNKPIELKLEVKLEPINIKKHRLNPPVDAQDALRAFYKYVRESGQPWRDHRDYLWPKWLTSGELTKFESSEWFQNQEASACAGYLTAAST